MIRCRKNVGKKVGVNSNNGSYFHGADSLIDRINADFVLTCTKGFTCQEKGANQ